MSVKLVNIGFGNIISAGRIISITSPDSAPAKRIIQEAREKSRLVDASHGKRFFKMAPLHHHLELSGWSEAKLVAVWTACMSYSPPSSLKL